MAQPIYFLPNLRTASAGTVALRKGILRERGLLDVFADVPQDQQPMFDVTGRGPGGLAGAFLCYQTPNGSIPTRWGFFESEQTWTPVGDGSQVWIGVQNADLPQPDDLARRKQYPGYIVTCGDHQWLVPVIRRPDGSTELPCDMVWDATGTLREPIKPAYEALWNDTAEVSKWFYEGVTPAREQALEMAIRALAINYRVGRSEQNVLRIIDRDSLLLVLGAVVDAPAYMPPKKTDHPTNAEPGSPEGSQLTALVEAICT